MQRRDFLKGLAAIYLAASLPKESRAAFFQGAVNGPTPVSGWSSFTPTYTGGNTQPSQQSGSGYSNTAGTRFVYVSQSTGSDSNTGTQASPVKTIGHGVSLLRSGSPDWLLLKKGDTWTDDPINLTGSGNQLVGPGVVVNADGSYSNIILFTSYPCPFLGDMTPGARPLLNASALSKLGLIYSDNGTANSYGNDCAFVGLELYFSTRDPQNASYSAGTLSNNAVAVTLCNGGPSNPVTWVFFEDMFFHFFNGNLVFQGVTNSTTAAGTLTFNRCTIMGSYAGNGVRGTQGLLTANIQNVVLTGNYWDQGGWNPELGIPTDNFAQSGNRNLYIQSNPSATVYTDPVNSHGGCGPATFSENINILSVAEGVQMRSGGMAYNNFFAFNAYNFEMGHAEAGHPSVFNTTATYNVSVNPTSLAGVEGSGISTGTLGNFGYGIVITNCSGSGCFFQYNILAHGYETGTHGVGTAIQFQSGSQSSAPNAQCGNGITVNNNIIYNFAASLGGTGSLTGSNTTTPNTIELNNSNTGGYQAAVTQTDPLGYYYTTVLGQSGATVPSGLSYISTGVQGFRQAWLGTPGQPGGLTCQCKDNWNTLLTAPAINDWYRTVFNSIIPAQGGY
jgi:hypothetical protein